MTGHVNQSDRSAVLNAAIQHALSKTDGIEWLRSWTEGDPEAMAELEATMDQGQWFTTARLNQ